jgi:hypothetical protein
VQQGLRTAKIGIAASGRQINVLPGSRNARRSLRRNVLSFTRSRDIRVNLANPQRAHFTDAIDAEISINDVFFNLVKEILRDLTGDNLPNLRSCSRTSFNRPRGSAAVGAQIETVN